jgi:hypothetical protein
MRTLSADQGLAGALARHSLVRPGASIEDIATGLVGLHNTTQPTPYLSMRARRNGFTRPQLDELMWVKWRLARLRGMRLTIFVFPRDLLEIAAAATRHISEPLAARWLAESGITPEEFERLAAAVEEALDDGPLTSRALRRELGVPQSVDLPGVIGRMCDVGRLVGGAPPRSWRSSVRQYHRWADVLPEVDLHRWREADAIRELIRRYVRSYGPVTVDDISWWTGFTKGRCRRALEGLTVEEVAITTWPGPLYRTAGDPIAEDPGDAIRALPLLDPYVQGYRDRHRFLDPNRHGFVFDGGGNSAPTLLHRGRIIGVWQVSDDPEPSVRYHVFADQPASIRRAAEADLAEAGTLHFDHPVDVIEMAEMLPLRAGGGRSASHPLDGRLHRASRRGTPLSPDP